MGPRLLLVVTSCLLGSDDDRGESSPEPSVEAHIKTPTDSPAVDTAKTRFTRPRPLHGPGRVTHKEQIGDDRSR